MSSVQDAGRVIGRYVLYDQIASGGMAAIHLGRMIGQVGFARTVAIKRLHPHFARDPEFVAMFIDEARLAAGIRHPNVVSTLDVVALEGDLFLVMEYVEGDSLSHLIKRVQARDERIPPAVVSGIVSNVLYGLHAAHTARDERGEPLHIVHRDVSPQNILVGLDGVARVVDFGVAKASRRIMETEAGRIKGKFRYMAPEQVKADRFDHRVDVFAAGIVLWEALTGQGLFVADEPMRTMTKVLEDPIEPPSKLVPGLPSALDAVVLRALERAPEARYASAREMAIELESALPPAVPRVIGEWVDALVGDDLRKRAARLIELGSESGASGPAPDLPAAAAAPAVEPPPAPPAAAEAPVPVSSAPEPAAPPAPAAFEPTPAPSRPLPAESASQVSEVSSAAWNTAAKRSVFPVRSSRHLPVVVGALGGGMALLVVALVVFLRARTPADEAPDVIAVPPSRTAGPAAPEVRVPSAKAPAPSAAPAPPAAPAASTSPAPPALSAPEPGPVPGPASSSSQTAVPPKSTALPKPAPKPAGDCNPPWVIDASGIKKFKRHCL